MSDIDLHAEFDRLDTGIAERPDLVGLWAGGQRRRRRTRAFQVVGGLAAAAVVAPLALLVGGGATTAPSAPGFAASTATPSDEDSHFDQLRAAVFESFPPADNTYVASSGRNAYNEQIDGNGIYFWTEGGVRLTAYTYASGDRLPCPEAGGCTRVGDRFVVVVDEGPVEIEGVGSRWLRTVQVYPTDSARTGMVEVSAAVSATSREEADATLPSAEALTELALDGRLTPPVL